MVCRVKLLGVCTVCILCVSVNLYLQLIYKNTFRRSFTRAAVACMAMTHTTAAQNNSTVCHKSFARLRTSPCPPTPRHPPPSSPHAQYRPREKSEKRGGSWRAAQHTFDCVLCSARHSHYFWVRTSFAHESAHSGSFAIIRFRIVFRAIQIAHYALLLFLKVKEHFSERPTFKYVSVALLFRFQFTSCTLVRLYSVHRQRAQCVQWALTRFARFINSPTRWAITHIHVDIQLYMDAMLVNVKCDDINCFHVFRKFTSALM